jgi:hypothetical protein
MSQSKALFHVADSKSVTHKAKPLKKLPSYDEESLPNLKPRGVHGLRRCEGWAVRCGTLDYSNRSKLFYVHVAASNF